jgi:DNA-binding NarL/FixJ family response regulator
MGNNSVMNQLKMSQQQSIVTLWQHGWSFRRIARELQLRREFDCSTRARKPSNSLP